MAQNFVAQVIAFDRWLETNYLPTTAQLLWFKLFMLFNKTGWKEWVQVDNLRLMLMIGVKSEKSALNARDTLVDAGLIEYRKGKKNKPNSYRMVYFDCKFYSEIDSVSDSKNDSETAVKTTVNSTVIDKHKHKHKQNIEEIYKEVPELMEAWVAFVEMRMKIKKPLTERAETMIWNKLNELAKDNPLKQAEILNQSTMHCWQTVYPLKEEEPPASYDIDEMEKKLLYGEIKYERKDA